MSGVFSGAENHPDCTEFSHVFYIYIWLGLKIKPNFIPWLTIFPMNMAGIPTWRKRDVQPPQLFTGGFICWNIREIFRKTSRLERTPVKILTLNFKFMWN
jgi:hypothetical protein